MAAQPPKRLIVEAGVAPGAAPASDALLEHAARQVRLDLTRRLEKEGFEILDVASSQAPADAGVLQVLLIDADPGSRMRRMLIGFGAGRGYEFAEFFADAEEAGLELDLALSTWNLHPFKADSDFLVAVCGR